MLIRIPKDRPHCASYNGKSKQATQLQHLLLSFRYNICLSIHSLSIEPLTGSRCYKSRWSCQSTPSGRHSLSMEYNGEGNTSSNQSLPRSSLRRRLDCERHATATHLAWDSAWNSGTNHQAPKRTRLAGFKTGAAKIPGSQKKIYL